MSEEPFYITYDLVVKFLQKHPAECVFELDAPTKIFNRLQAAGFHTLDDVENPARPNAFRECWLPSIIYDPSSKIDRRGEYGMIDSQRDTALAKLTEYERKLLGL